MVNNQKTLLVVLAVAVVASIGSALYFYSQLSQLKADPQKIAQEETQALVAKVGKLIVLPEGEGPTVATVTEPELLKDQPFFVRAKKGDKVLIYASAGKAILYDPENNKIVEVAPINIGPPSTPTAPGPANQPNPSAPPVGR